MNEVIHVFRNDDEYINKVYNQDCVVGAMEHIPDDSIDLLVCDMPFGIGEGSFGKHYNRDNELTVDGYVEVLAEEYENFCVDWLVQAARVLKPGGSLYAISGWTNLRHLLNVLNVTPLVEINHLIWKYNFGVWTKKKYVSSHYHILYWVKPPIKKRVFNGECRFLFDERDITGNKNYQDREDVWDIKKEYHKGEEKNKNKLPTKLVEKIIQYSSNPGDIVGDFFLGNFTTVEAAINLGRKYVGFELNKKAFDRGVKKIKQWENSLGGQDESKK